MRLHTLPITAVLLLRVVISRDTSLAEQCRFEAEESVSKSADVWSLVEDATASGKQYVVLGDDAINEFSDVAPTLAFDFELEEAGAVRTFVSLRGGKPKTFYTPVLHVRFDGGEWKPWTLEDLGHVFWNWNSHDFPAYAGPVPRDDWKKKYGPVHLWNTELSAGKHRLENLTRYAEGREWKRQEVAHASSVLANDVDERFLWLSRRGERQGTITFAFDRPQTLDAFVLWPFPAYDAVCPSHESDATVTQRSRPDEGVSNQSLSTFRVRLKDAGGGLLLETPILYATEPKASDTAIAGQMFTFGKKVSGVVSAEVEVLSNHGAGRTGASAMAFRTGSKQ